MKALSPKAIKPFNSNNNLATPTRYPSSFNIGVRLYQKGIKRMEERERFCREVKAEEERRKEEELVFQPQLVTRYYAQ